MQAELAKNKGLIEEINGRIAEIVIPVRAMGGLKEKENMKKEITWADVSLFLTKEITDHEETISFMDREDERNRLSIKVLREKNDELKARIKELEQSDANL